MMFMKKVMLFLMPMVAMSLLYTACNEEVQLAPQNANTNEMLSAKLLIVNYNQIENPVISDAGLTNEFAIVDDGMSESELPPDLDNPNNNTDCAKKFKDPIYHYLSQLELSNEQKVKIQKALQEFHKCKMFNYSQLKKINHEILAKAAKERDAILFKLKNNEITKEQAEKAIKALKEKVEFQMKNDPLRKKVLENLYKCHQELMENLRYILTKDQWEGLILFLKQWKP